MRTEELRLPAGSVLQGRYEIGGVLQERNTDIFYSALDRQLNRRVRIQEYLPHRKGVSRSKTALQTDEAGRERFRRGLELFCKNGKKLAGLAGEEDIVRVFSAFFENNTAYLVAEERGCMTLSDALEEGPFPEAEALEILEAACNALDKCHEAGLCHGMLGTDSFWLLGNRQEGEYALVLKDFALGKPAGDTAPTEKDVCDLARLYVRLVPGGPEASAQKGGRVRQLPDGELPPAVMRALEHEIRTTGGFLRALTGQAEDKRAPHKKAGWAEQKKAELGAFRMKWVICAAAVCAVFFAVSGVWTAAEHEKTARQKALAAQETQTETARREETSSAAETLPESLEPETESSAPTEPEETAVQEGQEAPAEEPEEEAHAAAQTSAGQERGTTAAERTRTGRTQPAATAAQTQAAETTIAPRPETADTGEAATIPEGSVARSDSGGAAPGASAQTPDVTQETAPARTQAAQELPTAQEQQVQLVEPRTEN